MDQPALHHIRFQKSNNSCHVVKKSVLLNSSLTNSFEVNPPLKSSPSLNNVFRGRCTSRQRPAIRSALRPNHSSASRESSLPARLGTSLTSGDLLVNSRSDNMADYINKGYCQLLPAPIPEEVKISSVLRIRDGVPASETARFFYEPLQLLKQDKTAVKQECTEETPTADKKTLLAHGKRELEMTTVSVPKTGAIKLTGLSYELDNPLIFDDRKELATWRERERYQAEVFGSTLPQTSCRSQRGALITNQTMMKRLREGEKEYLDELQSGRNGHSLMLETSVGDLLMNEMPELPTLNSNLQQFIEANINSNKERLIRDNTMMSGTDIPRDWSTWASSDTIFHPSKQQNKSLIGYENLQQQKKLSVSKVSLSKVATKYLENNKIGAVKKTKHGKAVDDLWHNSGNAEEEIVTFHQILVNAQKINLTCTNRLS